METFKNKWVILVITFLIVLVFVGFVFGRYHPNNSIVQELVNANLKKEKQQHEQIMKEKEKQLIDLQDRLVISQSTYTNLKKEVIFLRKELNNVKPPKTTAEIRKRFISLGYTSF